jgi:hypothetical protein
MEAADGSAQPPYELEFDSRRRVWVVRATRDGLLSFVTALRTDAPDVGAHVALGSHRDLLLIHAEQRRIDEDGIHGSRADFALLAELIERKLNRAEDGDTFVIDKQYGPLNRTPLELEVLEALSS